MQLSHGIPINTPTTVTHSKLFKAGHKSGASLPLSSSSASISWLPFPWKQLELLGNPPIETSGWIQNQWYRKCRACNSYKCCLSPFGGRCHDRLAAGTARWHVLIRGHGEAGKAAEKNLGSALHQEVPRDPCYILDIWWLLLLCKNPKNVVVTSQLWAGDYFLSET